MKWFRANIKHGARLALLALALQFGLSFGHFHAGATAAAAPAIQAVEAPSDISAAIVTADAVESAPLPASHNDSQHPGEDCAICAVIALARTVVSATPPAMLLPQAEAFQYRVTDAAFVDLSPAGVAFQPRAPPAS
ncbi:MAG: DUF2946 family protein [Bradyrhizobium sp.]|nr:DUF2946 family protein [Bradyrhizobium sp.]